MVAYGDLTKSQKLIFYESSGILYEKTHKFKLPTEVQQAYRAHIFKKFEEAFLSDRKQ